MFFLLVFHKGNIFYPKNFRRASRGIFWLIKNYKSLFLQRSAPQAKKIRFCTLFTRFPLIFATFCPDFFTIDQKKITHEGKKYFRSKKTLNFTSPLNLPKTRAPLGAAAGRPLADWDPVTHLLAHVLQLRHLIHPEGHGDIGRAPPGKRPFRPVQVRVAVWVKSKIS